MSRGNLFVVSGPSGVGKGTIISRIMNDLPNLWKSISGTTRSPRAGEADGREYFFLTQEDFKKGIEKDEFLEWAEYSGNYYGTPKDSVEEHLSAGENVILEIEVQGALQVKQSMPDSILVFIKPPSMEVLEKRLRGRGSEDEETIQRRLNTAELELEKEKEYNCTFVNDDLDEVVDQIEDFIGNYQA